MDKQLARQQYEQEKITKELQEAREKEEKKQADASKRSRTEEKAAVGLCVGK